MGRTMHGFIRSLVMTIAMFAIVLSAIVWVVDSIQHTSDDEQVKIVNDSVHRALITCYAVEGGYPESIDYLVDHYGLMYNNQQIAIFYDAFASNIMPEVKVLRRGADET